MSPEFIDFGQSIAITILVIVQMAHILTHHHERNAS